MRAVLVIGLAVLGFTQNAVAADPAEYDVPELRGSSDYEPPAYQTYTRWNGFYAGGQVEYSNAKVKYGTEAKSILANTLGTTPLPQQSLLASAVPLAPDSAAGTSFGAFVGYNTQFEDVVLGGELGYHRLSLRSSQTNTASPTLPVVGTTAFAATVTATSSANMLDYASLRGRVGYAFGSILPYATLGFVAGRTDDASSASVAYTAFDTTGATPPQSGGAAANSNKSGLFGYGYSVGLGVDWMLTSRIFLRAEWENVQFVSWGNQKVSLNAVRTGLGFRF